MILDTMSKHEVMRSLRYDFDNEVLPYYNTKLRPKVQSLVRTKSEREKRTINLGWETYMTKNNTTFHILKKGDKESDFPEFVSDFRWKGKNCYSCFFQNQTIVVYQQHCLERYAERVLKDSEIIPRDILYKHLNKKHAQAFHIVLPTPTHEHSWYLVLANALFLGDYEVPSSEEDKDFVGMWFNTCISFTESQYTQTGIMKSLQIMEDFARSVGYNPIWEKERYKKEKRDILKDNEKKEKLAGYLEKAYMMYLLHLSFDFSFTKKYFMDEVLANMEFIKDILQNEFSISIEDLSPFDKEKGIALKGEIDYRY